jgi:hypothetical protein
MAAVVQVPVGLLETVAGLRLPPAIDRRLQDLMRRSAEGLLTPAERDELAALAELSETIALPRAQARDLLGRGPG